MQIKKNIAAAVLALGAASLASDAIAQAEKIQSGHERAQQHNVAHDKQPVHKILDGVEWAAPSVAASPCPKLEGYPDCH